MTECAIKLLIIFIAVLASTIYSTSVKAQSLNNEDYSGTARNYRIKNTASTVEVGATVNVEAKALQLQNSINSGFEDIKPRLTPCGNRLYFSRVFHPGNADGVNDPEDIWYSDFDKNANIWSEPKHMSGLLNNAGPNYVNNVSVTGDTIILGNQYLKKGKMRAGLSYSVNVNGVWSLPTAIDIVNDYNMSAHSNSFVSLKQGVIIRSVQRVESIGGRDLFVSFWDGKKATEPLNMGTVINTEFEESSPFLAEDNQTLFFASKGHNGFGGYDIYMTKRLDDSWTNWSTPQNLGPAVNGAMDDEFFSLSHCGKYAVFSKEVNVHNTDLFRISMDELFNKVQYRKNSTPDRNSSFASL